MPQGNEHFGLLKDIIARMRQEEDHCWSAEEMAGTLIKERGGKYMAQYLTGESPEATVRSYFSTRPLIFTPTTGEEGREYFLNDAYRKTPR